MYVLTIHSETEYSSEIHLNSSVVGVSDNIETIEKLMIEEIEDQGMEVSDFEYDMDEVKEHIIKNTDTTIWYDDEEDDETNVCFKITQIDVK